MRIAGVLGSRREAGMSSIQGSITKTVFARRLAGGRVVRENQVVFVKIVTGFDIMLF
jgi:hypothetical protein